MKDTFFGNSHRCIIRPLRGRGGLWLSKVRRFRFAHQRLFIVGRLRRPHHLLFSQIIASKKLYLPHHASHAASERLYLLPSESLTALERLHRYTSRLLLPWRGWTIRNRGQTAKPGSLWIIYPGMYRPRRGRTIMMCHCLSLTSIVKHGNVFSRLSSNLGLSKT